MKAAVLHEYGTPAYAEFDEPASQQGAVVVEVAAAGLNHVDRLIASGGFYLGPPALPSVVGGDGVGRLADGQRVYFDACISPYGAMAERTLIPEGRFTEVPEGVSDAVAAALGNAGLAAWLSLSHATQVEPGDCVVILGATGAVGHLAIQLARRLGAGRIVAVGRDRSRLERALELGSDAAVLVEPEDDLVGRLEAATHGGANVVVDLLWGRPALAALESGAPGVRLMQVGQLAGADLSIPAAMLRSKNATIRGHANFWVGGEERAAAYRAMCELAREGELAVDVDTVPLEQVAEAWARLGTGVGCKLIVTPG